MIIPMANLTFKGNIEYIIVFSKEGIGLFKFLPITSFNLLKHY